MSSVGYSRMGSAMPLKRLRLTNIGPFDKIEFEFDEQVNVFTGPNNSGKSTVLVALGEIVIYPFNLPRKLLRAEAARFRVELSPDGVVFTGPLPIDLDKQAIRSKHLERSGLQFFRTCNTPQY